MTSQAVVALAIVLPDELPVRLDLVVHDLGDLRAVEALRACGGLEGFAHWRERGRRLRERHVDQSGANLGVQRAQPQLGLVDALVHAMARHELALPRVGPAVIRADDRADMSGLGTAEQGPAVPADVVERAHGARVVAHDQDRRRIDGQRDEVAGIRDLERESGEQPAAVPDRARVPARRARRNDRKCAACRGRRAAWRGGHRVRESGRAWSLPWNTEKGQAYRDASPAARIALRSGSYNGRVWRTAG